MPVKLHLIANEKSGGETDSTDIAGRLRERGATLVDEVRDAERIVVCGGDGTLGPAAALAAEHGLPLAVIPSGTANDFARAADLPRETDAAVALAVDGTRTRSHELGRLDGRPFVNAVSGGLSPAAARRAAPLKRLLGPLAYSVGGLVAGVLDRPLKCAVDDHFDGRAWQVIVACTGAFGGGAEIEATERTDGELDLVVVPARSRRELPVVGVAMRRGTLADRDDVVHARAAAFVLRVPEHTALNLDGELLDAAGALELSMDPRRFEVVCG